MSYDRKRFTLQITLRDNHCGQESLHMAIDLDEALRISPRDVSDMRMCSDLGIGLGGGNHIITMLQQKEFRRKIFLEEARRLGGLLADRMEDAEGWHDSDRIEPARQELGGTWK
jgi:hypothetical protein